MKIRNMECVVVYLACVLFIVVVAVRHFSVAVPAEAMGRTIRKVIGWCGIFELHGFFSLTFPIKNLFVGLLLCMNFFSQISLA